MREVVPLAVVAGGTGRDDVLPRIAATPRDRKDVIAREELPAAEFALVAAAVLAGVTVAREEKGVGDLPAEAPRDVDVPDESDDQRKG